MLSCFFLLYLFFSICSTGCCKGYFILDDIVFLFFRYYTALSVILAEIKYLFLGVWIFHSFKMFTYTDIFWIGIIVSILTYLVSIIFIFLVVGGSDWFVVFWSGGPISLARLVLVVSKNSVIFLFFFSIICSEVSFCISYPLF